MTDILTTLAEMEDGGIISYAAASMLRDAISVKGEPASGDGAVNHVLESRAWLASAQHVSTTTGSARVDIGIAQAHATLALVEQQRVANLIALTALAGNVGIQQGEFDEGAELASQGLHALIQYERTPATPWSGPDEYPVVRSEIRQALGLND